MRILRKWLAGTKRSLWVCGFGLVMVLILAAASLSAPKDSIIGAAAQNGQPKNRLLAYSGPNALTLSAGNNSADIGHKNTTDQSVATAPASAAVDVSSSPNTGPSPYTPPPSPSTVSSPPAPATAQHPSIPVQQPLPVIRPPADKCLFIERPDSGGNQIDYDRCVIYCPDSCGRCGGGYRPDIYVCVDPY